MEDIKVGDYIRAKYGIITQIKTIKDTVVWTNEFIDVHHRYNEGIIEKRDIIKHSPNIIDLIEVGDIIVYKSYSFDDILKEEVWKTKGNNVVYTIDGTEVNINSIKSIVTKEMFSSVEYRVENN